jgi:tetratricopeptide (TPR) repeat protein
MSRRAKRRASPATSRVAPEAVAASGGPGFDRTFWLVAAVLVPVTLLVYQPAWHGAQLWDDNGHITRDSLRSLSGLWRIWFEPGATQQYYPLVHTAFWVQAQIWGDATTGYHLVNIALHAVSACLLIAILRRLDVRGAFVAGVVFALHPVHVESVAWITELKNTLSGVFFFASALAYLRFDVERGRAAWMAALGLFLAAILSKSVTATLPIGLLVVLWWKRGRIEWARDVAPLVPFVMAGVAAGAMTVWVERTLIGAEGADFELTIVERVLVAGRAVWFYAATLVWPAHLTFNYPRWQVSPAVWWQYLYPLAAAVAIAAGWWWRHRSRAPLAAWLWFGVTLAPALGFVNVYPFVFSFVADHFQYLASAGLIVLGCGALVGVASRWIAPDSRVQVAVAVALAIPLAAIAWRDSHAYVSKPVLYETTIARNPASWLARSNLAAWRLEQTPPDTARALAGLREAVRLNPRRPELQFNLGLALEQSGALEAAAEAYAAGLARLPPGRVNPGVARAHESHARVLSVLGRTEAAAAAFARAIAAGGGGGTADAHLQVGAALLRDGRPAEAVVQFERAMALDPDRSDAHYALGVALADAGRYEPALVALRQVLSAEPRRADVHFQMGRCHHALGRREDAIASYRAGIAIDPGVADAHNDLGVALAELGRYREAVAAFAEAVKLKPEDVQFRENLDRARKLIR